MSGGRPAVLAGRHRFLVAAAAVMAPGVVAVLLLAAPAASAHDIFEGSNPVAGADLARPPEQVVLRFSEPVEPEGPGGGPADAVRLYDERGRRIVAGDPADGAGETVKVDLPDLGEGAYVVTWQVVSDDGHPLRGAFTFAVGDADAAQVTGLAERLLAQRGGDVAVGAGYTAARALLLAALLLLVGAAAFVEWAWPGGLDVAGVRRLLWGSWWVALLATIAAAALQGPDLTGGGWDDALDTTVLADVLDTWPGRGAVARLVLLGLGGLWLRRRLGATGVSDTGRRTAAVIGLGLVASAAPVGHALSGPLVPLGFAAAVVHLAALGLWLGGLGVLVVLARASEDPGEEAFPVVERFSRLAPALAAAVVLTGVVQGRRQVPSLDALTETDYGRLLVLKVLLFGAVLVAASASRDVVRRRVPAEVPPGDAAPLPDSGPELRRLRVSVAVEVALAGLVLAASAVLVHLEPPRDTVARPFIETLEGERLWFDVEVLPARAGPNDVHVTARRPAGGGSDLLDLSLSLSQPSRDIAPIVVETRRLGPGHYIAAGVEIPFAGEWELEIRARVSADEEVTVAALVPVG